MVIIITGASKGIGLSTANKLSKKGHKVYGFSRNITTNTNFTSISVDITDKKQISNAIKSIIDKENKIDILINNAGMGIVGSVEDTTKEEIHSLFNLNLIGAVDMISEVLPYMRKQKYGKIINISSIGSEMGLPFRGFYSASKSALDKITEALRYEVKNWNIQATSLHLGDIKTNIADSRIKTKISESYEKTFNTVYQLMNLHVNKGLNTEKVSNYIEKLIQKKNLKAHYYFGKFSQKIAVPLKFLLPNKFYEKLMLIYSKMN